MTRPTPPPQILIFSGKGVYFGSFVSGVFLNKYPKDMGFTSFPKNEEKWGMIYSYMFPEPSIASWEKG